MTENKEFVKALVSFYTELYEGVAKSIKTLSNIQKGFRDEYKNLKEIQLDPTKIYSLMEKLDIENKKIILDLMLRSQLLQVKFAKVFDMNSEEQKIFAKEIETFLKNFENIFSDLNANVKE